MTEGEIKMGIEQKAKLKRLNAENTGLKIQTTKNALLITNNYEYLELARSIVMGVVQALLH